MNQSGFSLVELIVVVAIIGLLSTLAVPQYNKLSHRASSSEAKVMLAAIHTAEKSFHAEYGAYHRSFVAIGFSPEGKVRYNVGFSEISLEYNAGVQNGYNSVLSAADLQGTNTLKYCDNSLIGGVARPTACQMIYGYYPESPPELLGDCDLQANQTYLACAQIMVPTNYVSQNTFDVDLEKSTSLIAGFSSISVWQAQLRLIYGSSSFGHATESTGPRTYFRLTINQNKQINHVNCPQYSQSGEDGAAHNIPVGNGCMLYDFD